MAKQINIEFTAQPVTTGTGFIYTIEIDTFLLYYLNGFSELEVNFIPLGDTPADYTEVAIGATLDETLQITLSYLRETYVNDFIDYSLNGNVIEVLINADATVTVDVDINDNIEITTEDVEPSGQNLIYYLIFDDYTLNIYKENYLGTASEIFGTFTLKKSSVDTILTSVRGTGLDISLEANQAVTFDEFLLNDEFTYKTILLKGSNTIFEGYIKPDGIQQSFVNDAWLVNIETVDGLGLLKDLSFVQYNGLRYTGKMSIYDVIKGCLDRTRLNLTINTSIAIEYIGYTGTNILKDVFVDSARFIKDKDDAVIMDCQEVLTSMLDMFSGVITQQEGQWWIYRPNDLEYNGYTVFINQDTEATFNKNLNASLGSQINGFYPHHCDANQQIEVKGAISAYRINYEYGFIDGLLLNPNLNHDEDMVYEDWTTNPSLPTANIEIVQDALKTSGLKLIVREGSAQITILTSSDFAAVANQELYFRFKASTIKTPTSVFAGTNVQFIIKIITSDGYYLNGANEWTTTDSFIRVQTNAIINVERFFTHELRMPPVLNDCDITLLIREVRLVESGSMITANITYCQIIDNTLTAAGIVGEFHTVSRKLPPSSITKENQKVFNGDGELMLVGSIYKDDLETPTDLWTRVNKFESLPLLGISAMDDLRIQSNPIKVFSGSIFGQIPYMSVVTIDNITGLFMPIEYDYDYKSNKSQVKLLQFYNVDLADIDYTVSPDFGKSTIKPTIKG